METRRRLQEDWSDESYVVDWLNRQQGRTDERLRQFAIVRSLLPYAHDQPFSYLNVGAGDGWLDEVLLSRFSKAEATLVDGSEVMVESAASRLVPFGEHVRVIRANLATPEWHSIVGGPFDVAVSTIAIHNLRTPTRIRALYGEIYGLLREGGLFLNLDYVRPSTPALRPLGRWAASDQEAGYISPTSGGGGSPGTIEEQLIWLREAGFAPVDCFWKEFQAALFGGFKGPFSVPEGR